MVRQCMDGKFWGQIQIQGGEIFSYNRINPVKSHWCEHLFVLFILKAIPSEIHAGAMGVLEKNKGKGRQSGQRMCFSFYSYLPMYI